MNIKAFIVFLKEQNINYEQIGNCVYVGDITYQFDDNNELYRKLNMKKEVTMTNERFNGN